MPVLDSQTVVSGAPASMPALPSLLEAHWHAQPALALPGLDPARQLAYFLDRSRRTIEHPAAVSLAAGCEGDWRGVSCWSPLPWDSRMYGFPAARLDLVVASDDATRRALVDASLSSARDRGIRHLIARVDAGDLALTRTLLRAGFELIDGIQTFTLALPHSFRPFAGVHTRLFEPADLDGILSLARTAYVFDRFHADAAVGAATAGKINEEWLRNSCSGKAAHAVLVAAAGPEVLGYATCKIDRECRAALGLAIGSIVMVATAAHARRQGIAGACTYAALEWFQRHDVGLVQVGTQLRNIPAARLYERCGFRIAANSLTWRIQL